MARKTKAAIPSQQAPVVDDEPLSLRDYIRQRVDGHTLSTLSKASGVSYSTLHWHVNLGLEMSARTARKLEAWSRGRISLAKTLAEPGKRAVMK